MTKKTIIIKLNDMEGKIDYLLKILHPSKFKKGDFVGINEDQFSINIGSNYFINKNRDIFDGGVFKIIDIYYTSYGINYTLLNRRCGKYIDAKENCLTEIENKKERKNKNVTK